MGAPFSCSCHDRFVVVDMENITIESLVVFLETFQPTLRWRTNVCTLWKFNRSLPQTPRFQAIGWLYYGVYLHEVFSYMAIFRHRLSFRFLTD